MATGSDLGGAVDPVGVPSGSGGGAGKKGRTQKDVTAANVRALHNVAAGNLKFQAGSVINPLKYGLTQSKLQSGEFLTSENLKRGIEQIQQQAQQIGQQIKIQRGLSAASGAGTSPVAQQQIQKLYTQLVNLNTKQKAMEQKAYIQNALANQQLELARQQYWYTQLGAGQAHDFLNQQPPAEGQAFG